MNSFTIVLTISLCLASLDVARGQFRRFPRSRNFGARAIGRSVLPAPVRETYGPPEPFEFVYGSQDEEGTHSHNQQGDANGRINGEYEIQLADGRSRLVKYYADDSGFYADVVTNELGTESKDPADVTIQSSAPTGPEAAFEAERIVPRPRGSGGSRFHRGFKRQF